MNTSWMLPALIAGLAAAYALGLNQGTNTARIDCLTTIQAPR